MLPSSSPTLLSIRSDYQSANTTVPHPYQATRRTVGQRLAIRYHQSVNRAVLRLKGSEAALLRAAATNDLPLVRRLVRPYFSANGMVTCSVALNQLDPAAAKAVAKGKTDALAILLEHGACPNKALVGWDAFDPGKSMFDARGRHRQHHVTDNLTPATVRLLLNSHQILPDTPIRFRDTCGTTICFTLKELINSNPGHKYREEICKMLVSHDPAFVNVNSEIAFLPIGSFAVPGKIDCRSFYRHPEQPFIHVNFIGQTLMFDNFGLTEYLLTDQDLDPGLPYGTGAAENLLGIFMDKYYKGCFRQLNERFDNLLAALRNNIAKSVAFCDQLVESENKLFKQQFLTLFAIEYQGRNEPSPADFKHLNHDQLNDRIMGLLCAPPPSYHLLFPDLPPSYNSVAADFVNA